MLKMTSVDLEFISDFNIHLLGEKDMRGVIFYITKIDGKANNKYIKLYDYSKPSKYITYVDTNNLYHWAMSQ